MYVHVYIYIYIYTCNIHITYTHFCIISMAYGTTPYSFIVVPVFRVNISVLYFLAIKKFALTHGPHIPHFSRRVSVFVVLGSGLLIQGVVPRVSGLV